MKVVCKYLDTVSRRTCDNSRCAEPAIYKLEIAIGEDVKFNNGDSWWEGTGPYHAKMNLCLRHRDDFYQQVKDDPDLGDHGDPDYSEPS